MKRYQQDLVRTKRVHQAHLRLTHGWPRKAVDCVCELQAGRFRKRKALGCRRSRCLVCHYEKVLGIASVKDRVREYRFKESLRDYAEGKERE